MRNPFKRTNHHILYQGQRICQHIVYLIAVRRTKAVPGDRAVAVAALENDLNLGSVGFGGNGNGGGDTVYRLREGIERFLITDINNPAGSARAQSEIAVMWDVINLLIQGDHGMSFNHVPGGGNVLYMDGHVEWNRYQPTGNKFPINELWAAVAAYVSTM